PCIHRILDKYTMYTRRVPANRLVEIQSRKPAFRGQERDTTMSNSSSYRYTRNNDTRSCRTTRPSRGSVIRLLLVSTTLLLTLSSWATPSMASEQNVEGSDSRPLTPRLDRPSGTTKPEAQSPKADEVFVGEDD